MSQVEPRSGKYWRNNEIQLFVWSNFPEPQATAAVGSRPLQGERENQAWVDVPLGLSGHSSQGTQVTQVIQGTHVTQVNRVKRVLEGLEVHLEQGFLWFLDMKTCQDKMRNWWKTVPTWTKNEGNMASQTSPSWAQKTYRTRFGCQEGPRGVQEAFKTVKEAFKRGPRGAQDGPRGAHERPTTAQEAFKRGPRGSKMAPSGAKLPQDSPKTHQDWAKRLQDGFERRPRAPRVKKLTKVAKNDQERSTNCRTSWAEESKE